MTVPTRRFANDDDAAQHWLILLREGDDNQKIQAREQLATIFERKGMLEEATDLLISNVHDGVRNADIYRWLARLYRNQGQEVLAMQAAAEAAKYMASPAAPPFADTETVVMPAVQSRPRPQPADTPIYERPPANTSLHSAPQSRPPQKKSSTFRTLSIGCIAVVLGLCLLGAIGSAASKTTPQTGASTGAAAPAAQATRPSQAGAPAPVPATAIPTIGQTVTSGNWEYTVVKLERKKAFTSSSFGTSSDAKGEWALIQMKLKNVGKQTYPIHTWDFEVHDAGGVIYKPDVFASSSYARTVNMSNLGGDFPPGVETQVGFATDINPEAKELRLKLTQSGIFIGLGG